MGKGITEVLSETSFKKSNCDGCGSCNRENIGQQEAQRLMKKSALWLDETT